VDTTDPSQRTEDPVQPLRRHPGVALVRGRLDRRRADRPHVRCRLAVPCV